MPGELVIIGAGGKRSLWKRNVQVLFSEAIFGEEFAFQAVQDTEGEFCFKSKAGGQGIKLGNKLILFSMLPQLPIHRSLSLSPSECSLFPHLQSFSGTWFLKGTFNHTLDSTGVVEFQSCVPAFSDLTFTFLCSLGCYTDSQKLVDELIITVNSAELTGWETSVSTLAFRWFIGLYDFLFKLDLLMELECYNLHILSFDSKSGLNFKKHLMLVGLILNA